jgi:hypothetical protein
MSRRTVVLSIAAASALLAVPSAASAYAPRPDAFAVPAPELKTRSLLVGESYAFDAGTTSDPDGDALARFEWDVDGDGVFELDTGASPTLPPQTITSRADHLEGQLRLGVRVTDVTGAAGTAVIRFGVSDAVNPWIEFLPGNLVNPGDELTLRATGASGVAHAWDLDGDGSFETDTGLIPAATYVASEATGRRAISLRASDDLGNVSVVKREIEVLPRHPSRDMIAWDAPANLGDVPTLQVIAAELTPQTPVAPGLTPVTPDATTDAALRRPTLRRVDGNRYGVKLRYTGGPKWSRWKVVVRLPAKRAASYGLPRRTFVMARGTIVFDGRGVGTTSRMRWTSGAYSVFRRVQRGRVDIFARRVA